MYTIYRDYETAKPRPCYTLVDEQRDHIIHGQTLEYILAFLYNNTISSVYFEGSKHTYIIDFRRAKK